MATAGASAPFSADALNRYRLAHNDRELRPVIRRLNRLAHPAPLADGQEPDADAVAAETELARLEVEKWKLGVERMLASVGNLERQRESYRRKAEETVARTEALKQTIAEEKALLVKRLAERDHRVKCDEVAKKILARGKTRKELEEQITSIEASIVEHKTAYEEVLAVAEARSETFTKIVALVDECRALKLPSGASPEPMEVDPPAAPATSAPSSTKLSATTLPFQPTTRAPASAPASRAATPAPPSGQRSSTPAASAYPSRPTRSNSSNNAGRYARGGPASLPPRPSNLRNVRPGGLEDGEVGESEDGEVKEATKRKTEEAPSGRSTRRK